MPSKLYHSYTALAKLSRLNGEQKAELNVSDGKEQTKNNSTTMRFERTIFGGG